MDKTTKEINYLVDKIAEGDNDAFRVFYDYYYPNIYHYVSYFVKDKNNREEIVADVFFNFWQNRKRNPEIENLNGYLYTMAKNTALLYLKNDEDMLLELDTSSNEKTSDFTTPESALIQEELNTAVQKAIDSLPERCRLVFLLAREEGLKYREIAELLLISEKTVNAQMVLAIKKLMKIIGRILYILLFLY